MGFLQRIIYQALAKNAPAYLAGIKIWQNKKLCRY